MINVITLCSGYDSQCMALEKIKKDFGLDYNLVAWAEIDKYACQAHDAVFPQFKGRNLGDMEKADWSKIHEDIDLLFYSTPCQDISNAGLQKGFKKGSGTRSSIIWSTLDAIDQLKPKYLILENVKDMVSNNFIKDFKLWYDALVERGYKNFWKVLNAKDFGVPQNRERVFMVSVRDNEVYYFPKGFELIPRLKDVLEDNVDEKYYLSDKVITTLLRGNEKNVQKGNGFRWGPTFGEGIAKSITCNNGGRSCDNYIKVVGNVNPSGKGMNGNVFDPEYLAPTLTTNKGEGPKILEPKFVGYTRDAKGKVVGRHLQDVCNTIHASTGCGGNTDCFVAEPKILIPQATSKWYVEVSPGSVFDGSYPESKTRRGRLQENGTISPTLTASGEVPLYYEGVEPNVLTPKRTEYGKKMRKSYEAGEIKESRHNFVELVPREDGISNTITTVQKDNLLFEPYGISVHPISRKHEFKFPQSIMNICPTIRSTDYKCPHCVWYYSYRIRKLTERECFRLMGCNDDDIDKIKAAGISKTQQYKMAGNSIVVDVLYHIFRKLFIDKLPEEGEQLTLF